MSVVTSVKAHSFIGEIPEGIIREIIYYGNITELWALSRTCKYFYYMLNKLMYPIMKMKLHQYLKMFHPRFNQLSRILPNDIGEVNGVLGEAVWATAIGNSCTLESIDYSYIPTPNIQPYTYHGSGIATIYLGSIKLPMIGGNNEYPYYALIQSYPSGCIHLGGYYFDPDEEHDGDLFNKYEPIILASFYLHSATTEDIKVRIAEPRCIFNSEYLIIPNAASTLFGYIHRE